MADELKHKAVGGVLTQSEYETIAAHEADNSTSNDIFSYNGTSWVRTTLTTYLASQKNIVIPDDGVLQMGDTDGQLQFIPWTASGSQSGVLVQPGSGNRIGFLALQPKGTEDSTQLILYNSPAGTGSDNSTFNIQVNGDTVTLFYVDAGSPSTSIAHLKFSNPLETVSIAPQGDENSSIGSSTLKYQNVYALHHWIFQAIDTDHRWSGTTAPMTAGTALTIGQAVYVGGDSKMEKAIAPGTSTMPAIALATGTISENAAGEFLMQGFFRDDTWTWSIGGSLYISKDTAGALTQTKPSASGQQVQAVGVAITAKIIHFNPSYDLVAIP